MYHSVGDVDVERGSELRGVVLTREQKLQLYRDGVSGRRYHVDDRTAACTASAPHCTRLTDLFAPAVHCPQKCCEQAVDAVGQEAHRRGA
jgi:hypothetical protein